MAARLAAHFRKLLPLPFAALKESLRGGYRGADFRSDLLAGIQVGIIAMPLAMALAIASGVPPQYGLYTSIIAGFSIALLGGSRVSVSGPTAAFVVLLAPIAQTHGLGGLVLSSMLAGCFLFLMGAARLGTLIQFIPHPVTTGFTAGIAVVIATLQIKDFLGLTVGAAPGEFVEKVLAIGEALPTIHWPDAVVGLATLGVLILCRTYIPRYPGSLIAAIFGALLGFVIVSLIPGAMIDTIQNRFTYIHNGEEMSGIPAIFPMPQLPWLFPGADGEPIGLSIGLLRDLLQPALAIAVLGAIESLLCAVAADGMAGTRHDPDAELLAQGTGNLLAPFFGGFAATGAIARTAANIRAGGKTPIAAAIHSVFLLLALLLLSPILGYLPMATLAAVLIMVAWNMSDIRHFIHILHVAPKGDIAVLLTCFTLTVIFDMVVAVTVGIVLAALLFMRRMAELTHSRPWHEQHELLSVDIPPDVVVYEIAGPLFFGAAEKTFRVLEDLRAFGGKRAVILNMHGVPTMDVTGMVALETILAKLKKHGLFVILAGVGDQPRQVLKKAHIEPEPGKLAFVHDLEQAVMVASLEMG